MEQLDALIFVTVLLLLLSSGLMVHVSLYLIASFPGRADEFPCHVDTPDSLFNNHLVSGSSLGGIFLAATLAETDPISSSAQRSKGTRTVKVVTTNTSTCTHTACKVT